MKEGITGVLVLLAFMQPRGSTSVLLELRKINVILKKDTETKL